MTEIRGSECSSAVALEMAERATGSEAIGPLWSTITTLSDAAPSPEKSFWIMPRA